MSSSYIVEPQSEEKKDDTLIIVVNDDGTLSVDQATLQNLISKLEVDRDWRFVFDTPR